MSHIIKTEQDTIIVSQLLEKLRSKGCTEDVLDEILNTIIPQNQHLPIDIVFNASNVPAAFSLEDKDIEISLNALKKYIDRVISILIKIHPTLEKEIFYNHILLVLVHEVEHYYQCLILRGYVEFPYELVKEGYKNLFMLKISKDLNPASVKAMIKNFSRYSNKPDSLLERNANVEAYEALVKVAKYENNKEMLEILKELLLFNLSLGYKGLSNGSMEKTYRKKRMIEVYNSFDHTEDIPIQDRIRYGLPIDKDTRKKVLKKQSGIIEFS